MRLAGTRSSARLFGIYAALSLIPVLLLGVTLAASYRDEAKRRGIAEGQSEAALVAHTAIEPLLDGRALADGVPLATQSALGRVIRDSPTGTILRLRLRDLSGKVVFSGDGSGRATKEDADDDEALDAARGEIVTRLTRLNADGNDNGPRGVDAVEAYRPLTAGDDHVRVGVLELYLPYGPIRADVSAGLASLYRNLILGLGALYVVLFGISMSVSRALRQQLGINAYMAEHDTLTGLPNRTLFHRQADEAVAKASETSPIAVAIVDLDRFKEVNESLGHHNGDRLLTTIADRLARDLGTRGTLARLGGDEFGVVLAGAADTVAALSGLRDVINQEVDVSGLPVSIEASIGYVIAPNDGREIDTLLQRADVAMYVAKTEHSGVVRYDPAQDHYDASNLSLLADLRRGIDEQQLILHYQPQAALVDGHTAAVEALVRWQHPTLGLLMPDRFLPLAERTDLIDRLTDWVLATALADMQALGPAHAGISVAVNVSARSLARADFADRVLTTLDQHRFDPHRFIMEITETALMGNPERAAMLLAELAAAGVRVSIDDFGKGQTSLGYLSALTVHELKIDQSFVTDMLDRPAHAAIVRSIVDLGHNLELRVVGEGVETDEVLDGLRQTGCDIAQGYVLARPMPLAQLGDWLERVPTLEPEMQKPSPRRPTLPSVATPGAR